ncbi:MAG: flagellar hook-associated protein FlgK [Desulfobacteraceae bacterium]|nr:flagellar hook-associated protein FlgK [Desulfobacteraceae bacterium]
MAGLIGTLETAKNTILNTQLQIQTSSHNIANAESTTYARQKAVVTSNAALYTSSGWLGSGASVSVITQVRDEYIDKRVVTANSDLSQYSTLATELNSIQATVADDGETGISEALGEFWDAWDTLSQDSSSASNKTGVYVAAENLASTIKTTYNRLNSIKTTDIPEKIQDATDEVNNLLDTIAELNAAISKNETDTAPANDLRDSRYAALKELSALIPVTYTEDSANGMVDISTTLEDGSSLTLLDGTTVTDLTTTNIVAGGELGGLNKALTDLTGYMDRLTAFTNSLVSQVNSVHTVDSGAAVFTIGADPSTIVASTTFLDGVTTSAESSRALNMATLQGTNITFSDGKVATFSGYLSDIQKEIGSAVSSAKSSESFNESLLSVLETQQQAVSGVSLEEELVDLLKYQQVYQAAAKIIEKTQGLLDTVVNMVR